MLDPATRRAMADAAARIANAVGYTNAGTLEFLLDRNGAFYFLEMNTRLQVEHPVTEMVTGIDIVQWQLRLALGERLTVSADAALTPRGHAIECRIYAEDPDRGFLPSPGWLRAVSVPGGPGVRDDRGAAAGYEIPSYYDSLISKLVVWADTRTAAIGRLQRALDEYRIVGVKTTLPFFRWLVRRPEFAASDFSTTYLDERLAEPREAFVIPDEIDTRDATVIAALAAWLRVHQLAADRLAPTTRAWRQAARREALR